jgi:catechol 2,3-dioxygenase-like lactoylglutathione lyase family enzyme
MLSDWLIPPNRRKPSKPSLVDHSASIIRQRMPSLVKILKKSTFRIDRSGNPLTDDFGLKMAFDLGLRGNLEQHGRHNKGGEHYQSPANILSLMTLRPHHIGISVSNLDRSLDWYGKNFGFVERSRTVLESGLKIVYISNGTFEIEVFEQPNSQPLPGVDREVGTSFAVQGYKHFAFEVEDVDAYWADLVQKGLTQVSEPKTNDDLGVRYCFISDPDGILLEFLTRI